MGEGDRIETGPDRGAGVSRTCWSWRTSRPKASYALSGGERAGATGLPDRFSDRGTGRRDDGGLSRTGRRGARRPDRHVQARQP